MQKDKMTKLSQDLRSNATKEENALWYQYLRRYPVQFRRQCIFGGYIVDFYCAKADLVVELDGSQHYDAAGIAKDEARTRFLESLGLQVLRFSNTDVNRQLNSVCQQIDEAVKARYRKDGAARGAFSKFHKK